MNQKELKITEDKVFEAMKSCPQATAVLEKLFAGQLKDELRVGDIIQIISFGGLWSGSYFQQYGEILKDDTSPGTYRVRIMTSPINYTEGSIMKEYCKLVYRPLQKIENK